jgi:hypothetical protein
VGALGNDSGPVIFAGGFLLLLLAAGYVRGSPEWEANSPQAAEVPARAQSPPVTSA